MLCEFEGTTHRIPAGTKLGAVADKVLGEQVFVTVTEIGGCRLGVAVSIRGVKSRIGDHAGLQKRLEVHLVLEAALS